MATGGLAGINKLSTAGRFALRQGIEIGGDPAFDVAYNGSSFTTALGINTISSIGGEALFGAIAKRGGRNADELLPVKKQHPNSKVVPRNPNSKIVSGPLEPGDFIFAQTANRRIHVLPQAKNGHPTILGNGKPTAAAGEIFINSKGVVSEINNISFTFQHNSSVLSGVKNELERLGFKIAPDAIRPFDAF